ncbi:Exonuclease 1 [Exaiptasia diaphana]|nr:Exonuclease 1 [Exaiptasia diaphana]
MRLQTICNAGIINLKSSTLEKEVTYLQQCWEKCINDKIPIPTYIVRLDQIDGTTEIRKLSYLSNTSDQVSPLNCPDQEINTGTDDHDNTANNCPPLDKPETNYDDFNILQSTETSFNKSALDDDDGVIDITPVPDEIISLNDPRRYTKLEEFQNKIAIVDASCWIHKCLATSLQGAKRSLDVFEKYLNLLKNAGVRPYIVFDGLKLPAKADEDERRRNEREKLSKRASEARSADLSKRLLSQAASITFEDISECVKICISQGIPYIVSPYESDVQITYLMQNGHGDFVITEDSDLLAYGCEEDKFLDCCITAGCDYLRNVRGIGIHKAFQLHLDDSSDVFSILDTKGAPPEYKESFKKAKAVFCHQTVFDPVLLKTTPLNEWPSQPSQELQIYCGIALDDNFANDLAVGNIDTKTSKKQHNYQNSHKPSSSRDDLPPHQDNHENSQDGLEVANLPKTDCIVQIVEISDKWLIWTIQGFPVMSLEFNIVKFRFENKQYTGLIKRGHSASIGNVKCNKQCNIEINNERFTVLWEPRRYIVEVQHPSTSSVSEPDGKENELHSLPFKVMGTCYDTRRQDALIAARDCMYEHNRYVFAKLEAEPENLYDENAIAVYLACPSEQYLKCIIITTHAGHERTSNDPFRHSLSTAVFPVSLRITTNRMAVFFNTEEVLEQVLRSEDDFASEEEVVLDEEDSEKDKIREFLGSYEGGKEFDREFFVEKATEVILPIVKASRTRTDADCLCTSTISAASVLNVEGKLWLKSIHRRLGGRVSVKKPYFAECNCVQTMSYRTIDF